MAKTKNKVALAIIVAVISAFATFAPSLLGLLGINQFYEMIQQKFGANMEVVVSKRINKQFYKQIQDSSRTPTRGGVCGARMRVACRYKGMSERAIRNFERRTGAKVNYEDSHIPGRMKIGSIEFDGKTLTPDMWEIEMRNNPKLRSALRQAMKPRVAMWFGGKMKILFGKLGIDKAGGFIKENTVDRVRDIIKARQKGATVDIDTYGGQLGTVDENGNRLPDADENNAANDNARAMAKSLLGDNPEITNAIGELEAANGGKITRKIMKAAMKEAVQFAGRAVSITGAVDLACTVLNVISAVGYIAKALGSEQLIRFVQTFQSSFDGLRAGDGTSTGFQALGELLFTPGAETGKSAFESYGYSMMSGSGLKTKWGRFIVSRNLLDSSILACPPFNYPFTQTRNQGCLTN